jgi:hypothetical protein
LAGQKARRPEKRRASARRPAGGKLLYWPAPRQGGGLAPGTILRPAARASRVEGVDSSLSLTHTHTHTPTPYPPVFGSQWAHLAAFLGLRRCRRGVQRRRGLRRGRGLLDGDRSRITPLSERLVARGTYSPPAAVLGCSCDCRRKRRSSAPLAPGQFPWRDSQSA